MPLPASPSTIYVFFTAIALLAAIGVVSLVNLEGSALYAALTVVVVAMLGAIGFVAHHAR